MSLNLTINIAPNRDVITPLNIGEITYNDPEILTTDIITEILVLDAPVPFQRFAATAPFNSVLQSDTYPELLPALQTGDTTDLIATGVSALKSRNGLDMYASAVLDDFGLANPRLLTFTDSWQALVNARIAMREAAAQLGSWKTGDTKVASGWAFAGSSAFGPQLDLFSRYNKWFASTSWLTASSAANTSYLWPVLFIYVDRVAKRLYNVEGTIAAEYDGSQSSFDNLIITQATVDYFGTNSTQHTVTWSVSNPAIFDQFVVYLGGRPTDLVTPDDREIYTISPVYSSFAFGGYIVNLLQSKKVFDVRVEGRKNGSTVASSTYKVIRL